MGQQKKGAIHWWTFPPFNFLFSLNQEFGTAILFITHNPALLAGFASRVIVMQHGCVVEQGRVTEIFRKPVDPFTRELLNLVPTTELQSELHRS